MDLHRCDAACHGSECAEDADLREPARRGLFGAGVLCVAVALAAFQLATRATDDLHRVMFGTLAGALMVAGLVLQVVRIAMGRSARST